MKTLDVYILRDVKEKKDLLKEAKACLKKLKNVKLLSQDSQYRKILIGISTIKRLKNPDEQLQKCLYFNIREFGSEGNYINQKTIYYNEARGL